MYGATQAHGPAGSRGETTAGSSGLFRFETSVREMEAEVCANVSEGGARGLRLQRDGVLCNGEAGGAGGVLLGGVGKVGDIAMRWQAEIKGYADPENGNVVDYEDYAAPDCPRLHAAITEAMAAKGFHVFVVTEW